MEEVEVEVEAVRGILASFEGASWGDTWMRKYDTSPSSWHVEMEHLSLDLVLGDSDTER